MAHLGSPGVPQGCPQVGVKLPSRGRGDRVAFDSKRESRRRARLSWRSFQYTCQSIRSGTTVEARAWKEAAQNVLHLGPYRAAPCHLALGADPDPTPGSGSSSIGKDVYEVPAP
jgi:hypothetical protein